jgi:hypothetical protein
MTALLGLAIVTAFVLGLYVGEKYGNGGSR